MIKSREVNSKESEILFVAFEEIVQLCGDSLKAPQKLYSFFHPYSVYQKIVIRSVIDEITFIGLKPYRILLSGKANLTRDRKGIDEPIYLSEELFSSPLFQIKETLVSEFVNSQFKFSKNICLFELGKMIPSFFLRYNSSRFWGIFFSQLY